MPSTQSPATRSSSQAQPQWLRPIWPIPSWPPEEILLRRDVLDTQVVDLQGQRLSRVSEIVLVQSNGGSPEVAAVQLGLLALLPRLGLGRIVGHRPQPAVDWQDLHLTSPRAHTVQLATTTAGYHRLDPAGLAELLARLSTVNATAVLRTVDPGHAAIAVHQSHPLTEGRLLGALGPEGAAPLLATLSTRDPHDTSHPLKQPSTLHQRRFRRTAGWRRLPPVAVAHPDPPISARDHSDGEP